MTRQAKAAPMPRQIAMTPLTVAGLLVAATMTACAPKGTEPASTGDLPLTQPGDTLPADSVTTQPTTIGDVLPATMPVMSQTLPAATQPATMPVVAPASQPAIQPSTMPTIVPETSPTTKPAGDDGKSLPGAATDPAKHHFPEGHSNVVSASTQPVAVSADGAVTVPAMTHPATMPATQPSTMPAAGEAKPAILSMPTTQPIILPATTQALAGGQPVMLDVVGTPKAMDLRSPAMAELAADLQQGEKPQGVVVEATASTHPGEEASQASAKHAGDVHEFLAEPTVSTSARWAGVMVLVSLGMFLASAVIGPIMRSNAPAEPADDGHGHDDHQGHGGHDAHGH